jgi:hypothetical protein
VLFKAQHIVLQLNSLSISLDGARDPKQKTIDIFQKKKKFKTVQLI